MNTSLIKELYKEYTFSFNSTALSIVKQSKASGSLIILINADNKLAVAVVEGVQ